MTVVVPIKSVREPVPAPEAVSRTCGPPLLRLSAICKTFSTGTAALADVDLTICSGEFISLLGPSGCGKSTLLKLIAGLTAPSSGAIGWPRSTGEPSGKYGGKSEPALGFVFQDPTLLPWRTVTENVYLPLQLSGVSKSAARERIAEALDQVGLHGFADSYPRQLSGGMKMRVSIARALVTAPQILLMDEPFAALDEIARLKLNDELLELFVRRGLTVVFVTHSVYESVFLSSRIVVLSSRPGRIAAEIPIVTDHPRSEEFRTSAIYNEQCRLVLAALRRAMNTGDAD
ncbi:MAG TPA: ABC transporter ATP-binding protein [Xanthobacteraceae bacterium]|jgi:NitT/TauT family transport system ATP-binding protein